MYSTSFSHYYDQLMGDYSSVVNTTKLLISNYIPKRTSILELGCGTGNILKELCSTYTVSGLDIAPGMLEQARKKVPGATFYLGDMTLFRHNTRYDGILCIFDTINHLQAISQWQRLFASVHKHLKPGGIFIFDMNTKKRLERLSSSETYVGKLNKETLTCVKISKKKSNTYGIKFQVFEGIHQKEVIYTEEEVVESAFPKDQVMEMLSKSFSIERMVDPIRKRTTSNTGRIFFVCRKK